MGIPRLVNRLDVIWADLENMLLQIIELLPIFHKTVCNAPMPTTLELEDKVWT